MSVGFGESGRNEAERDVKRFRAKVSGKSGAQPASSGVCVFSAKAWISPPINSPSVA